MGSTLTRRNHLSRRDLLRRLSLSLAGLGLSTTLAPKLAAASSVPGKPYKTYWGDLHNHNVIGYAQGSLERTFEIARNHLDFFAFTPHAHWHDIGSYENRIENRWINGFAVTKSRWPEVLKLARRYDAPGKFVPMVGYEWHSTSLGDRHIVFPDLEAEFTLFDDLKEFQRFAKKRGCILIPHHPANRRGHRGANFSTRDPEVEPVLEMYSEWGNAEHDRAPFPYIRHSHGGRWTQNTLQYLLAQGHRMGVIASTDDHLGYPGAYREGLAAVKATDLSRQAIFDAIRNRRTYAVTGDRIELDFSLNSRMMGQELPYQRERKIQVSVTGWDQVNQVEVLKNNRVIHRDFPMDRGPMDRIASAGSWERPVLIRFEYGWGPWAALGMGKVAAWDIRLRLDGGTLEDIQTCFQSGPFAEGLRDRIVERTERSVRVESFTARRQQFEDNATKAVVLKVRGTPETRLNIELRSPGSKSLALPFKQLAASGESIFTGPYPRESVLVHRLVFDDNYRTAFTVEDEDENKDKKADWYYTRVIQANGQLAWSSPIWVESQ